MDAVEGKNNASHSDFFWQIQISCQNHSDFLSLESGRSATHSQDAVVIIGLILNHSELKLCIVP